MVEQMIYLVKNEKGYVSYFEAGEYAFAPWIDLAKKYQDKKHANKVAKRVEGIVLEVEDE